MSKNNEWSSAFDGKVILITGGTGSFGQSFSRTLIRQCRPKTVRVFSRDELKQYEMNRKLNDARMRFFLGDVRDSNRIHRACEGVDIVIHAAALKQVPACEYNPFEAIKTNIIGAVNLVDAAIDCDVDKVIAISTDKAVNPVNLYDATKLCSDKVFIHGNSYTGARGTRFACVRYGNVIGSRGSVLPLFLEQRSSAKLCITDRRMTRFWISLDQAAALVNRATELMVGGEVFVPKIPSMKVIDLARAVAPNAQLEEIGIRPGEKIHESLITDSESRHTLDLGECYVILPEWFHTDIVRPYQGDVLPNGFSYTSDANDQWISQEDMMKHIRFHEENET